MQMHYRNVEINVMKMLNCKMASYISDGYSTEAMYDRSRANDISDNTLNILEKCARARYISYACYENMVLQF